MAKKAGFRTYPLTMHKGLKSDIDDCYVSGLCRNFGINEPEFRGKL